MTDIKSESFLSAHSKGFLHNVDLQIFAKLKAKS